jgi:hypothetical protein
VLALRMRRPKHGRTSSTEVEPQQYLEGMVSMDNLGAASKSRHSIGGVRVPKTLLACFVLLTLVVALGRALWQ